MRAQRSILMQSGALALALGIAVACNSQSEKKSTDDKESGSSNSTNNDSTSTNVVSDSVSDFYGSAFYTGYDGTTDFSLLLPSFASYTLDANDIATIEEVKVTLSESIVTNLINKAKQKNPNLDESQMKKMFSRTQTTFKITPLKAGRTTLRQEARRGRDNSSWKQGNTFALVVNDYSSNQVASGKERYTASGTGNLRACASCHESGQEGAPPHELGRIMEISDTDALTWIKTGALGSRKASVTHTWEFNSAEQEAGIVAYLRSKQTHDVEQLAALYFEEFLAGGGGMPPPGGGGGGGGGSNTSSSTSTGN